MTDTAEHSIPTGNSPANDSGGVLWGIGAYLFWGAITIFWKALKHFNAFELIGYRITSSALVMGIGMQATGNLRPLLHKLRDRTLRRQVVVAAVVLSTNWTVYVWAVVNGHVLEVALGYFVTPIGLMIVGIVVLREPVRPMQVIVFAFAVAAVVVLTVGLRPHAVGSTRHCIYLGHLLVGQETLDPQRLREFDR